MAKFFDAISKINPIDDVADSYESSLRRHASRITPEFLERKVPSAFKDFAATAIVNSTVPGAILDPDRALRSLKAILAADHEVGLQLSQALLPKTSGPINLEGLGAEVFRPSNVVPVSKIGTVLKGGKFAIRPLLKELGKESAVASGFSAAEEWRLGGSAEDIALSGGLGAGIGGVTPFGLHAAGRAGSRLLGRGAAPDASVLTPEGAKKKRKTRVSNMTLEEQIEATNPTTLDAILTTIDKTVEGTLKRIQIHEARLREPIQSGAGRQRKKGNVYAEDILTVNGNLYPLRVVKADAGILESRPVIQPGTHTIKGAKGKERRIGLTTQQASDLQDLYDTVENPTLADVRETLREAAGRSVREEEGILQRPLNDEGTELEQVRLNAKGKVERRTVFAGDGEKKPETTRWQSSNESFDDPDAFRSTMFEDEYEPLATSQERVIDDTYAQRVKSWVESQSPRAEKPVLRPAGKGSREFRRTLSQLREFNQRIFHLRGEVDKALDLLGKERLTIEQHDPGKLAEAAIRNDLKKLQNQIDKAIQDNIDRGKKQGKTPELTEEFNQLHTKYNEITSYLTGETPLRQEWLDEARSKLSARQTKVNRSRLTQHEQEANRLQQEIAEVEAERARLLETDNVPQDPADQEAILAQRFGTEQEGLPPPLAPSEARSVYNKWVSEFEQAKMRAESSLKKERERMRRLEQVKEALSTGKLGGLPYTGRLTQLAHDYANYLDKVTFRDAAAQNPNLINRPARATESLADYARVALVGAYRDALGGKSPDQIGASALRNLAEKLANVHDRVAGPGARAFITDESGNRVYGMVKMVQPADDDPANWLVDFVPEFGKSRDIVQSITVKDVGLEYRRTPDSVTPKGVKQGFDAIQKRYETEREFIADVRSEEQARVLRGSPELMQARRKLTELRQQTLGTIKPLSIEEADLRTMDDLNREVEEAWALVQRNLMPDVPAIPDDASVFAQKWNEALNIMVRSPLSRNPKKAAEQIAARREVIKKHREYLMDRSGLTVDGDPEIAPLIDQAGDPVLLDAYLLTRGMKPDDLLGRRSSIIPRKMQGALDFVTGHVFKDERVSSINTLYHWDRNAVSDFIMTEWDGITQSLRKSAIAGFSNVNQGRATMRPKGLRFSYGDKELSAVMSTSFNPAKATNPEINAALSDITKLPDDVKLELMDIISREQRWFLDYTDELFPDAPAEMKKIAQVHKASIERINDLMRAQTDKSVSIGYLNRMMLDRKLWDLVDAKTLSEGHPLKVLAEAARVANDNGWKLRDVLVSGEELVRAEPLAYWTALQDSRMVQSIRNLADPETPLEKGDIIHLPGKWSIKSRDKFKVRNADGTVNQEATRQLQDSIGNLERGMNRLPDWGGLDKLSRAISSMVLTLDANIVSVQGYAAISSRIMYDLVRMGTGRKAALTGSTSIGSYFRSLKQVMSDEGYYAWRRSRADDINFYAANGMSVGQSAFIAGPKLSKFPMEDVAVIGALPKFAREFNDLQFNRLLTYLKVTSIDQMLSKANVMRKVGPSGSGFMTKLPGIKDMIDEAGGEGVFFHGQPEHIVRAAVRSVNNKLGGVDLNAQGIGQYRQIAERIMTITPGFFRAQAGMFSTALSRPKSVEGWMAMTGIAEETAFALGVATAVAAATGNLDKLNYDDITRADWMAAPFEDSYIPVIPRPTLPRLAARLIASTVDAAQGEGFDAGPAVQSFAQGRLSPLVSATVGSTFFDEDFLGRRYRDKKDRLFAGLTSLMPIFVENVATEAREGVEQDGWGSLTRLTYQTPIQFAGKNIVPRPPVEKLDEYALHFTQTEQTPRKWFELTRLEQEQLMQKPHIKAAHDDFTYYQERRQSPKEQQVEAAFRNAEERVDMLRTQPFNYNGQSMTMDQAYKLLLAGQMDGDDYRERLRAINQRTNETMENMEIRLKELGFDLDAKTEEKEKRLREIFKGSDSNAILTQLAVWDAQAIQPEAYTEDKEIQTPNGPVIVEEIDWEAFQTDREAVLQQYSPDIQQMALDVMSKWEDEGVAAYEGASVKRQQIEELPRYRGLTNEQADKVDAMTKTFRDMRDSIRAKIGLPGSIAELPTGFNSALRRAAVQMFVQQGFLRTEDDLKLAMFAVLMEEKPIVREAMRGPEHLGALLQNPDVLRFYPYLMSRVPVWMRGRLPEDLQPNFDVQHAYEEMVT